MAYADFDPNIFAKSAQAENDKHLLVKFYFHPKEDKAASEEEGRPVYKEVEYISITLPGTRSGVTRPARSSDKSRFPAHYQAFKDRVDMPVEGTPLAEWPGVSRSQVEELAFSNIKTVEQLANVADSSISHHRSGVSLKQRAAQWLAQAKSSVTVADLEAKLASRDKMLDKLQAQVEKLQKASDGED